MLCSEFLCKSVVELFHGDGTVSIVVKTSQECMLFMVGHVDAEAEKIKFM
jgi:hypothetical protein